MTENEQTADSQEAVEPDETPEVRAAAEAVRRAREELERARETYMALREEAAAQVRKLRESTVGDVVKGSLEMVRKHPATGVAVAAMVGFFLGRVFRR